MYIYTIELLHSLVDPFVLGIIARSPSINWWRIRTSRSASTTKHCPLLRQLYPGIELDPVVNFRFSHGIEVEKHHHSAIRCHNMNVAS